MNPCFCAQCGRRVPMRQDKGQWLFGKCPLHPSAMRLPWAWIKKQFAAIRAIIAAAPEQTPIGAGDYVAADARRAAIRVMRREWGYAT